MVAPPITLTERYVFSVGILKKKVYNDPITSMDQLRERVQMAAQQILKYYEYHVGDSIDTLQAQDVILQEKTKRLKTVAVSLESIDSVGELVEESVVKLEPLNKSSSSESDYLDVEEETLESEACGENLNTEQTSSAPQSTEETLDIPHADYTTPVPEVIEKCQRRKPDISSTCVLQLQEKMN
ncbi:unnamed protein product [Parnassius apollo]|uniref:(apollo) hypothetical protein n=1 Tax=Parnassius apollo TaxID=110799 RepID=A0A8S3XDN2_PARAO|nr:unnamed protein product [Parnassius apollo]